MRTLCDSCESAAAQYFCAADEAALCSNCDEKVHGCNKLANRHLRLQLRESWSVPRCDICESAPAFLHCSIDGSSLCLQCDMDVHVGGKRTHQRYLLLGQRVELPNGHHLRDEKGNPNAVDTARAWQNKYCQEHLHKVNPRRKSNDESDEQKD